MIGGERRERALVLFVTEVWQEDRSRLAGRNLVQGGVGCDDVRQIWNVATRTGLERRLESHAHVRREKCPDADRAPSDRRARIIPEGELAVTRMIELIDPQIADPIGKEFRRILR